MTTDEPALTDDEIVALSRLLGGRWRAVLPTLDPDDQGGLGDAVFRGERSLLARGLLSAVDDSLELDPALANLARVALNGQVTVSAYTADADLTFNPTGFTYLNYAQQDSDDVLVEVVAAIGLHRFGLLTRAEAADALLALADAVHAGSAQPDAGAGSDTLCLALPTDSPTDRTIFTVRPGSIETAIITPTALDQLNRESIELHEADSATLKSAIDRTYVA